MSATSPDESRPRPRVLATALVQRDPWPHFTCAQALGPKDLAHVEALYARAIGWERHRTTLYHCVMRDVTAELDPEVAEALVVRMRSLTGQALTRDIQVTAQKMAPGDDIGLHNDRPLLGYEAVRLVVQLNRDWRSEHGGLFQMYPEPTAPRPTRVLAPTYNSGVGFSLSERSHHAVTRVTRERRSMVMSFWHVGSTAQLRTYIEGLCSAVPLAALPAALDPVVNAAERELPEERSFAAAKVACILQHWGYDVGVVERGYRAACSTAREPSASPRDGVPPTEEHAAIELARWAVHLRLEAFDLDRWRRLSRALWMDPVPARLRAFWQIAFPSR